MRLPLFALFFLCICNSCVAINDRVTGLEVAEDGLQQAEQHASLLKVAKQLVAPGKGLLAADESTTTMGRRFKKVGVANTLANRAAWRHALLTTPGLHQHISGVILTEETFYQTFSASGHTAGASSSCEASSEDVSSDADTDGSSAGTRDGSSSAGSTSNSACTTDESSTSTSNSAGGSGSSSSAGSIDDSTSSSGSTRDSSSGSTSGSTSSTDDSSTSSAGSSSGSSSAAGTGPCRSQRLVDVLHKQGILVGVKVDLGVAPLNPDKITFPNEPQTKGLDGLLVRCRKYAADGATFAKWRAVLRIDTALGWPTQEAVAVNAQQLADYAAAAQAAGLVPIVEPEVLVMEGAHDLRVSEEVSARVLSAVFAALLNRGVLLEGIVLKPAMVLPGSDCSSSSSSSSSSDSGAIAAATLRALRRAVPPAVPGIAFLSGGQSEQQAAQHLAASNQLCRNTGSSDGSSDDSSSSSTSNSSNRVLLCPWVLTFSFGRALQISALQAWAEDQSDVVRVQALFAKAAATAAAAAAGGDAAAAAEEAAAAVGACAAGAAATCSSSVTS